MGRETVSSPCEKPTYSVTVRICHAETSSPESPFRLRGIAGRDQCLTADSVAQAIKEPSGIRDQPPGTKPMIPHN